VSPSASPSALPELSSSRPGPSTSNPTTASSAARVATCAGRLASTMVWKESSWNGWDRKLYPASQPLSSERENEPRTVTEPTGQAWCQMQSRMSHRRQTILRCRVRARRHDPPHPPGHRYSPFPPATSRAFPGDRDEIWHRHVWPRQHGHAWRDRPFFTLARLRRLAPEYQGMTCGCLTTADRPGMRGAL